MSLSDFSGKAANGRPYRDFRGSTVLTPVSLVPVRYPMANRSAVLPRPSTPEQKARREIQIGIDSCVRTIGRAEAEKKLDVFRQQAQEAFRLGQLGGLDIQDVGDRIYEAGAHLAGLEEEIGPDRLTAVLGDAKDAVLTPPPARSSDGTSPQNRPPAERELIVRRASDISPEKIEWLWPGRVAVGKLTLIGGTPGLGKSQLTAFAAKVVSVGGQWPCSEGRAPRGNVILLSAEDGLADTIIPRLTMAGADLERVSVVLGVQEKNGRRGFDLKGDIAELEKLARKIGDVRLIIIDPISAYMGGTTDANDNVKTRNVLEPVAEMADRLRISVVAVTHLNKSGGAGQSALNRFIGSIAFVAAARAAFAVVEDAEDKTRRLFLQVKNNLAKPAHGLAFRIEQAMLPGTDILASGVCFDPDPVEISANDALAASEATTGGKSQTGTDETVDFLRDALAGGSVEVLDLEAQACKAGLLGDGKSLRQSKVFRAARKALGVISQRDGFGKGARYVLRLPDSPCAPQNIMRAPSSGGGAHGDEGAHDDERGRLSAQGNGT